MPEQEGMKRLVSVFIVGIVRGDGARGPRAGATVVRGKPPRPPRAGARLRATHAQPGMRARGGTRAQGHPTTHTLQDVTWVRRVTELRDARLRTGAFVIHCSTHFSFGR